MSAPSTSLRLDLTHCGDVSDSGYCASAPGWVWAHYSCKNGICLYVHQLGAHWRDVSESGNVLRIRARASVRGYGVLSKQQGESWAEWQ